MLFAFGVATLAVHAGVVILGPLRLCWGVEHTHAGAAAPDCPMHHHASQATQPAHHEHGSSASEIRKDSARISCDCSNGPTSISAGATALIPVPAALSPSMQTVMLVREGDPSPADLWLPALSPPPRSTPFQLS